MRFGRPSSALLVQIASLLVGAAIWEVYGRVWGSGLTVPPFSDVVLAVPELLADAEFWEAVRTTLASLGIGLALVLPLGYAVGALVGLSRVASRLLDPYLTVGLAAPMVAAIPLIVIAFGLTTAARVATVVLFAAPMLASNVSVGYREFPGDLVEMSRSFGVSRVREFVYVRTMAALPAIFVGLRLALGRALVGVIVAELLVLSVGLGRLLIRSSQRFEGARMYAVVLVVLLVATLLFRLMGRLEARALRTIPKGSE